MVAWSLKCNICSYIFLDCHEPGDNLKKTVCHAQHTNFYINRMPISYSTFWPRKISKSQFVRILLDYKGQ